MTPPELFLASASPRRAELLQQLGIAFQPLRVAVDETRRPGEAPRAFAERLAADKARAGVQARPAGSRVPVLGADTIVVVDDRVMGKPAGRDDAIDMLLSLSDRTHEVITAVAVAGDALAVCSQLSRVSFGPLDEATCAAYWETGEPRDKAGAYAIQGRAAVFIRELQGSYSGVMGLPLYETAALLRDAGIKLGNL